MDHLLRMPAVHLPADTIYRPRLKDKLDLISQKKLTLITAGAGYGKTTLAAQALTKKHLQCVWLRYDGGEKDPGHFIRSLFHGVQKFYPELYPPAIESRTTIKDIGKYFYRALENMLTSDLFLVVDDCQAVCQNSFINAFLQQLLDRHIPGLHLVLISRGQPDLKLSRLMVQRQVLQFLEPDLAFTRQEIKQFFQSMLDVPLSEKQIGHLHEKSGGWVSGLMLFYHALREKTGSEIQKAIPLINGTHKHIADYLKENIFDHQAEDQKAFLMKTSILSDLKTDFCNNFLEIKNARSILCDLEDRHCFTFSANEDRDRFFYHDLFQDFLKNCLASRFGTKETHRLYNRAARLYEKERQGREALKHHILAGNMADASRLLNQFARPMIKQDRPQILKSLLATVPEQYMDDEPWFQYLQAGYFGLCSQIRTAVSAYEKVLKNFRTNKDEQGECLCLMELAEHYLASGEITRSENAYKKILDKKTLDPYLTIIVMGHLIRVLAISGRPSGSDKYAKQAMELLARLDNEAAHKLGRAWIYAARGYRYLYSGSYQDAMRLGEDAKSLFKSVEEYRFISSSYFLIAYSCFYLGRFSKGMAAAKEGIHIAARSGVSDEFSEFLPLLQAKNSLETKEISSRELKSVFQTCEKCLISFESGAFPGGVAHTYLVLHRAYLKKGDIARAEKTLRKGIAAIEESDMPLIRNELQVSLSELLLYERNRKREAFILLKDAEQNLLYSGWHMAWISKIFARYYWVHGHLETARKYMIYCLKISEEETFDTWLIHDKNLSIPLLADLYCMGSMQPYIETLFKKMGPHVRSEMVALPEKQKSAEKEALKKLLTMIPKPSPPPITAFFFERFRLFVGNREIRAEHWKSHKAKNLFKYLLAMRNKGYIEKDILMELLWPDDDPQLSSQRFHVAMASIRKTLEPDIFKGEKSSYISRSGQAYRIKIGEKGRVDIEDFSREISAGKTADNPETAIRHFRKALSVAQGEFLEEDVYEEWCGRERKLYRQTCLKALKKIIQYREDKKDYSGCVSAATTYIEKDPYAEDMVRKLMRYYSWMGNQPMISRVFRQYQQFIKTELGCGISRETRQLYEKLSSHQGNDWNTAALQAFRIPGSL